MKRSVLFKSCFEKKEKNRLETRDENSLLQDKLERWGSEGPANNSLDTTELLEDFLSSEVNRDAFPSVSSEKYQVFTYSDNINGSGEVRDDPSIPVRGRHVHNYLVNFGHAEDRSKTADLARKNPEMELLSGDLAKTDFPASSDLTHSYDLKSLSDLAALSGDHNSLSDLKDLVHVDSLSYLTSPPDDLWPHDDLDEADQGRRSDKVLLMARGLKRKTFSSEWEDPEVGA
jgi:hypothetical protein